MNRLRGLIAAGLIAALGGPAYAFTPESGNWWNPNTPGVGWTIEIQDDYVFMTGYYYTLAGDTQWYTAQGHLDGNDFFANELDTFANGQCLGCAFTSPTAILGAGGPISVEFTSETTARMTVAGQVFNIERFNYFLGGVTEKMLGEWQMIDDFSEDPGVAFPFYADVLVFDLFDSAPTPDVADGCRADNTLQGFCSDFALANHSAAAVYDSSSGEHVIVVDDSADTWAAYYLTVGTSQADGFVQIYFKDDNPNGPLYPVRAFRTASRTFVETGSGPSSVDPSRKEVVGRQNASLAQAIGLSRDKLRSSAEVPAGLAEHLPRLQALAQEAAMKLKTGRTRAVTPQAQ